MPTFRSTPRLSVDSAKKPDRDVLDLRHLLGHHHLASLSALVVPSMFGMKRSAAAKNEGALAADLALVVCLRALISPSDRWRRRVSRDDPLVRRAGVGITDAVRSLFIGELTIVPRAASATGSDGSENGDRLSDCCAIADRHRELQRRAGWLVESDPALHQRGHGPIAYVLVDADGR